MTLLSESTEGMHNLFRLSTGAWRDGFFKQPRATASCWPSTARG
jgi:DNA polymerase-3 subunit alpha